MVQEATDSAWLLGETLGFWIQTTIFFVSAIGAIAIIYNDSHQNKKRATIDLALHETQNEKLALAKEQVSKLHANGTNFTPFACGSNKSKTENKHFQTLLNNYEFIASGIKEGAFNELLYHRMRRSIIIRDWNSFEGYINELRKTNKNNKIYCEFEWLAKRWVKKEINPNVHWWRRLINCLGL